MPWYDFDCQNCGILVDEYQSLDKYQICPICGEDCEVLIAPVRTVGIVYSNPECNEQIGVRWETNAQKRDWMRAHPNAQEMGHNSADDKNFKYEIRNQADRAVRKKGFRDLEDFKAQNKKAKAANSP